MAQSGGGHHRGDVSTSAEIGRVDFAEWHSRHFPIKRGGG
jgi:hypothetical protein